MLLQKYWGHEYLTINIKPESFTIGLEAAGNTKVFGFDYEGRCWTGLDNDISFRQGLDGKIIARSVDKQRNVQRWYLSEKDAGVFREQAREVCKNLQAAFWEKTLVFEEPIPEHFFSGLSAVSGFDSKRAAEDLENYKKCYKPVGILPPDQYMSLVLQASEGCSFNTCTFCSFYKNRPFHIKSVDEFEDHVKNVKSFLGRGISNRKTIFLGDANALVIPVPRLIEQFQVIHKYFDVKKLGGIFAFLDGFSGEKKTVSDYKKLKRLGLQGVFIGMESGHQPLLGYLKKPGSPDDVLKSVKHLKRAGVKVGIIVLLGAGGKKYAEGHVKDTIAVINRMPLDLNDIVYFSELVVPDDTDYMRNAFSEVLSPLSPNEIKIQQEHIESGLKFSIRKGTPHISKYDIREFVY